jgi:hypothetical protein
MDHMPRPGWQWGRSWRQGVGHGGVVGGGFRPLDPRFAEQSGQAQGAKAHPEPMQELAAGLKIIG